MPATLRTLLAITSVKLLTLTRNNVCNIKRRETEIAKHGFSYLLPGHQHKEWEVFGFSQSLTSNLLLWILKADSLNISIFCMTCSKHQVYVVYSPYYVDLDKTTSEVWDPPAGALLLIGKIIPPSRINANGRPPPVELSRSRKCKVKQILVK